jgi:hypothetical protein
MFGILNFGHAQRRRLRRVLGFVCDLEFVIWNIQPRLKRFLFDQTGCFSGRPLR